MTEFMLNVIGVDGVGKTALTLRLAYDKFIEEYDPFDGSHSKEVIIDDQTCLLDISETRWRQLDTLGSAAQVEVEDMWGDHCIHKAQGFLIVYSVTSPSSFHEVSKFRDRILRVKDAATVPIVIVGNKCDLINHREVSTAEGCDLAKSFGVPFFESSAKNRINVEEACDELVREIRRQTVAEPSSTTKKPGPK